MVSVNSMEDKKQKRFCKKQQYNVDCHNMAMPYEDRKEWTQREQSSCDDGKVKN